VGHLALSNGPNRVGAPCPTPEDGNIQFPERCVLKKYWMMNKVQKLNNPNTELILNYIFTITMNI
jgi:hypothetical protein